VVETKPPVVEQDIHIRLPGTQETGELRLGRNIQGRQVSFILKKHSISYNEGLHVPPCCAFLLLPDLGR